MSNIICLFFTEISLPNMQARMDILKIHAGPITKHGEIGNWRFLVYELQFLVCQTFSISGDLALGLRLNTEGSLI